MIGFVIRVIGILLIAIGMFCLGSVCSVGGVLVGLLLIVGTVIALFPSIFTVDDRN